MTNLIHVATSIATISSATTLPIRLNEDLRIIPAADDTSNLWEQPQSLPTLEDRKILAGDLARKHGLSVDRAEMLVDRFGSNRQALEGAAQALRTRMD